MKKILLAVCLAAVLAGVVRFHCTTSPQIVVSGIVKGVKVEGGDLVYRVNLFGIFPVAQAILKKETRETYDGKEVFHLSAEATALPAFAAFFKGYVSLDSYLDVSSGNPLCFRQRTMAPGKEEVVKEILYDQKEGIMRVRGMKRQILPDTQDPLSVVYNLRRADFDSVKHLEMNLNTNKKNYILEARVMPLEVRVGKGTVRTVFLRSLIKRRDNNPYHRSDVDILLLRDTGNIPVLIKVFASGMFLSVNLIETR